MMYGTYNEPTLHLTSSPHVRLHAVFSHKRTDNFLRHYLLFRHTLKQNTKRQYNENNVHNYKVRKYVNVLWNREPGGEVRGTHKTVLYFHKINLVEENSS